MSSVADLRAVLAQRDFRKLYATRLTAQASDGAFQVALASFVFFSPERAGTAAAAAATFAVLLLPYTVLGPFAGVLLDRWSRRQVLVGANVARAGMVALVAAIAWGESTGPALYLSALATVSINRFFLTALSAALPRVVARERLIVANSLSVTSGSIAAMAGGGIALAIGALVDGRHGDAELMLGAAAGYLVSAALAARMDRDLLGPDLAHAPPAVREAVRHVAAGLAAGARHVWAARAARNALAATTALRFCYGMGALAAILLYRNQFNDPGADGDEALAELGVVFAAAGVGYVVAAVFTPTLSARFGKPRSIVGALAAAGVLGFALGVPYAPPLVVAASFVLGVTAQIVKICVDTIVQEAITDVFRGRVFAFYDTVFNLSFVAAAGVAAVAMPDSGKSYPLLVAVSAGYVLTALLFLRATVRDRPAGTASPPAEAVGPRAETVGQPAASDALDSARQDAHPAR